ncbi:hypothetical protein RvY_15283 [Ramazzottius varieornatus]|uniref:Uncharacterized protein n=1 Tax=Ramazzottius varieornatus TaxID=947166 RepID=A0A1D1W194_RAMVA|nr:hypothetical protein RvY_15283 [Ramazzottius varieornatus]
MDDLKRNGSLKVLTFFHKLSAAISLVSFGIGTILLWLICPLLIGYSIGYSALYALCQMTSHITCPAESPYASVLLASGLLLIGYLLRSGNNPWIGLKTAIKPEVDLVACLRYSPFILPLVALLMYSPASVNLKMARPVVNTTDVTVSTTYVGCATTYIADAVAQWTLVRSIIAMVALWLSFYVEPFDVAAALVINVDLLAEEKVSEEKHQERVSRQRRANYFALVLSFVLTIIGGFLVATTPVTTYYYMQLNLLTPRSELYILATFLLAILLIVSGVLNIVAFTAGEKMNRHLVADHNGLYYLAAPLTILSQLLAGAMLVERVLIRNYDRYCYDKLQTDVIGGRRDFNLILEHDWLLHGFIVAICALLVLCYKSRSEFGHQDALRAFMPPAEHSQDMMVEEDSNRA